MRDKDRSRRPRRVLFTGGGTGGHITPGLAILDAMKRLLPRVEACWIGTPDRREATLIPQEGIPFFPLKVRTVRRSMAWPDMMHNGVTILDWLSLRPLWAAHRLLSRFHPDVVVATGGYVCAPVAWMAWLRRIPVLLLEQNAALGFSVRLLCRWARKTLLAYEGTQKGLPRSVAWEVIGNPVRDRTLQMTREEGLSCFNLSPQSLVLLITGGSLGSKALDEASVQALRRLDQDRDLAGRLVVLFHTGEPHFEWVKEALAGIQMSVQIFPYLDKMAEALAVADVAITRAGAMTVAELTARGVPAVLVPWAGAARDHQRLNCQALVEGGGARVILDQELTGDRLHEELVLVLKDEESRSRMAEASRRLGRPQASDRVVSIILEATATQE